MADKQFFDEVCYAMSRYTTKKYSTSFSTAIRLLKKDLHEPIYNIYGFVRFADEIVDSFHGFDKEALLEQFQQDTYQAIAQGIHLNPILNSFQKTVRTYGIERGLIDTFLQSMAMDLHKRDYTQAEYETYILGSAEVVGLMCLRVFVRGDDALYEQLKPSAMRLGAAFQKINFLRDLREDAQELNRMYFPGLTTSRFDAQAKAAIEADIEADFNAGLEGIKKLPKSSRFGVYLAYIYYTRLFKKIKQVQPEQVMQERIRVPNSEKLYLVFNSYVRHNLNLL